MIDPLLQAHKDAMDAVHQCLHDPPVPILPDKPFTCFKCDTRYEDWEGSECETCGEFFCDDHLVTDQQAMAPECCHGCADEAAAMDDTHATLRRPD